MMSSSNDSEQNISIPPSDRSSKHEQELRAEAASCQDESESKKRAEDDEEFSTSLSVGDGHYLVDLGSSSEFVVDEACILELFRSCRRCSRHCRVMKRVHGLKIVVSQTCCFCENRFEWTNLPDDFGVEDDRDFHIDGQTPTKSTPS
ncbi:hypothetical protein XENORESO_002768 [Xenotaenia resolanae]|uniref:Uncharacterized protein n=1 Tax=Xenotaenia resolanae TaxID=208358 RepID=A0ABV0VW37_9TELE